MYESIKYDELKQLPDEQKKEALQEFITKYGSNKAIAEVLGSVPIAISNMIKKYVNDEPIGRKKKEETTVETPKNEVSQETKPKRKYTKKTTIETKPEPQQPEIIRAPIKLPKPSASFTTSLNGELSGEEIKERVSGIVNALLNSKTYSITLQVEEK